MLVICSCCGKLYNAKRKRIPNYCSTACRVRRHRQRRQNGGWPLAAYGLQAIKDSQPGPEDGGEMTVAAQPGAHDLANLISGDILAAESLDRGSVNRDDGD